MSKIICVATTDDTRFVSAIRSATGREIAAIRNDLKSGVPFYEGILFMNDHREVSKTLRQIAESAKTIGVNIEFYELDPDEEFAPLDECRLTTSDLTNLLDETEERYR